MSRDGPTALRGLQRIAFGNKPAACERHSRWHAAVAGLVDPMSDALERWCIIGFTAPAQPWLAA